MGLDKEILKFLYKNHHTTTQGDIKDIVLKYPEVIISQTLNSMVYNKHIIINQDWLSINTVIQGRKRDLNELKFLAIITPGGEKYYRDYAESNKKYKFWLSFSISVIGATIAVLGYFKPINRNEIIQISKKQDSTEKRLMILQNRMDAGEVQATSLSEQKNPISFPRIKETSKKK